jgi:thiamine-monophosphate kinase
MHALTAPLPFAPLGLSLDEVRENRILNLWSAILSRHPDQENGIHESDAELLPLPGSDQLLAVTVDTVAEEIALGFYSTPETIGWMAVTSSLSDLAAVGAAPLGLLIAAILPDGGEVAGDFQARLAAGIEAACRDAGTHILGGDTNRGDACVMTSCAVGLVPRSGVIRRVGCRAGERVYATGPLGAGAAAAARGLLGLGEALWREEDYRPRARLREAMLLRGLATSAMDTSDGLVATLDQLARLNRVAMCITEPAERLLDPRVDALRRRLGLSPFPFLAAEHGEFELVFTLRPEDEGLLLHRAAEIGWEPLLLGHTAPGGGLLLGKHEIDGARIRNLVDECGGDPRRYLELLLAADPSNHPTRGG